MKSSTKVVSGINLKFRYFKGLNGYFLSSAVSLRNYENAIPWRVLVGLFGRPWRD